MSLLRLSGKIAVCSILSFIFVSLGSGLRQLLLVAAPWKCFGEVMGSIAMYEYSGKSIESKCFCMISLAINYPIYG